MQYQILSFRGKGCWIAKLDFSSVIALPIVKEVMFDRHCQILPLDFANTLTFGTLKKNLINLFLPSSICRETKSTSSRILRLVNFVTCQTLKQISWWPFVDEGWKQIPFNQSFGKKLTFMLSMQESPTLLSQTKSYAHLKLACLNISIRTVGQGKNSGNLSGFQTMI